MDLLRGGICQILSQQKYGEGGALESRRWETGYMKRKGWEEQFCLRYKGLCLLPQVVSAFYIKQLLDKMHNLKVTVWTVSPFIKPSTLAMGLESLSLCCYFSVLL